MENEPKDLPFENCLHNLCYPNTGKDGEDLSSQDEAREILLEGLRILGNLLTSLPKRASGPIEAANRTLITRGINDLLLAFHSICCGYYPQAQNLLRPIIESYNLMLFFKQEPDAIDAWVEGGQKARKQLAAAKVRAALYGDSSDPMETMYSFLCEAGSHPRFRGTKSFVAVKKTDQTDNSSVPSLTAFIGGKRLEPLHSINLILCLFMLKPLFLAFIEVYPDVIGDTELDEIVEYLKEQLTFGKSHFPNQGGKDDFQQMLDELERLISRIEDARTGKSDTEA